MGFSMPLPMRGIKVITGKRFYEPCPPSNIYIFNKIKIIGIPVNDDYDKLVLHRARVSHRLLLANRVKKRSSLEDEAERKVGWFLKLLFSGTATAVGYQFFPYMGDNLMQQSISMLHVKDPLFKRMGASRLACYRWTMKIVNLGGGQELLKMLESAKDDRTRKDALKALAALSTSDEAVRVLHSARLVSMVKSIPDSLLEVDIQKYRSSILKKCQDLRYDMA